MGFLGRIFNREADGAANEIVAVADGVLLPMEQVPDPVFSQKMMGDGVGMTVADIITMLINCVISFWVFYPILKIIFKEKEGQTAS